MFGTISIPTREHLFPTIWNSFPNAQWLNCNGSAAKIDIKYVFTKDFFSLVSTVDKRSKQNWTVDGFKGELKQLMPHSPIFIFYPKIATSGFTEDQHVFIHCSSYWPTRRLGRVKEQPDQLITWLLYVKRRTLLTSNIHAGTLIPNPHCHPQWRILWLL